MSKEVKVRNFRIKGIFRDHQNNIGFTRDVRAIKETDAVEKIILQLGSNHAIKRNHIKILEIQEISAEKVRDPFVKEFATNQSISVRR